MSDSINMSDSLTMGDSINMDQLHFARDVLAPDVFAALDPPQMTRTWFEISLELGLGLQLCLALDVTHSKGKRNTIRFSCPSRSVVIEYFSLNLCDFTDFAYAGWIWSLHIEQIGQFERQIQRIQRIRGFQKLNKIVPSSFRAS